MRRRYPLIGLLAALAACADGTGTRTATPARLVAVDGDLQTGTVGQALALPLRVRVVDPGDRPLGGTQVAFQVTGGGGTVASASATTDDAGMAATTWTLGTSAAAAQSVEATVTGRGGEALTVRFTATARPGPAASLVAVVRPTGGVVNEPVADSLAVRAVDGFGNPVAGVPVDWAATEGGSTVSPERSVTGTDGMARARWTLGPREDVVQTAHATAAGLGTIHFGATAASVLEPMPGEGDGLTIQAGSVVPVGVLLRGLAGGARDVPVQWTVMSGGGYLAAPVARTTSGDHPGIARNQWTLGPNAGVQTLRARAGTLETTITLTATPQGNRTLLAHMPGPILDAQQHRLLWVDTAGGSRVVILRPAPNGVDSVIKSDTIAGPDHLLGGHLTPYGTLVWNRHRLFHRHRGVLIDRGPVEGAVSTNDEWAAWSSGAAVIRLHLETGDLAVVSSEPGSSVRVGANGDVVFLRGGRAWRYRAGAVAEVSVEGEDPLTSIDTDGVNVVYATRPAGGPATVRIDRPGGDLAYRGEAGASDGWASYGLNGGWVVFSVPPIPATRRSPSGAEAPMRANPEGMRIEAVSPLGGAVYVNPVTNSYVMVDRWGFAFPMGVVVPGSSVRWRETRFQMIVGQDVFELLGVFR